MDGSRDEASEESEPQTAEASETSVSPAPRFQISLRSTLLLTAVCASLLGNWFTLQQTRRYQGRLATLRNLDRRLLVGDPTKFVAVQRISEGYIEAVLDIHIPKGKFELCLATEGLGNQNTPLPKPDEMPAPLRSITLSPGSHSMEVRQRNRNGSVVVIVLVDGTELWSEDLAVPTWGGSVGGSMVSTRKEFDSDKPAILFRRRMTFTSNTPGLAKQEARGGVGPMLWLQPEG